MIPGVADDLTDGLLAVTFAGEPVTEVTGVFGRDVVEVAEAGCRLHSRPDGGRPRETVGCRHAAPTRVHNSLCTAPSARLVSCLRSARLAGLIKSTAGSHWRQAGEAALEQLPTPTHEGRRARLTSLRVHPMSAAILA